MFTTVRLHCVHVPTMSALLHVREWWCVSFMFRICWLAPGKEMALHWEQYWYEQQRLALDSPLHKGDTITGFNQEVTEGLANTAYKVDAIHGMHTAIAIL